MVSVQAFGSSAQASSLQASNQRDQQKDQKVQNRSVKPAFYQDDWTRLYTMPTIPDPYGRYARQGAQVYSQQYAPSYSDFGTALVCNVVPGVGEALVLRNAYGSLAQTYEQTKALPPKERSKKRATTAGDVVLSNLLGAIVIPGLVGSKVNTWVKEKLQHPKAPAWATHHPKTMTVLALGTIGAATAKPVNALVNGVLDWTYRPLVEKQKREKRLKELQTLQAKAVQANVEARRRAMDAYYAQMKAKQHTAAFQAGIVANEQIAAAAAFH